jgi:hypothetical protein
MSVADALHVMRDPEAVAELAECASGVVPECSTGMEQLISSYVASPLARFHRDFYSTGPDPPDTWLETYNRTDLGALPPCARFILEHPNDPLIKPSGMRRIVAVFLPLGWHPRHIAWSHTIQVRAGLRLGTGLRNSTETGDAWMLDPSDHLLPDSPAMGTQSPSTSRKPTLTSPSAGKVTTALTVAHSCRQTESPAGSSRSLASPLPELLNWAK